MEDVNERQRQGWVFRKTKLSEAFDFEDAQEVLPSSTSMLLLLRDGGQMRFFTHASRPEPKAGDIIISFSPPHTPSKQGAAAKKARKEGGKIQPA